MTQESKKILIVEDEGIVRKAYTDELREQKFTVFEAKNGQEGLELALLQKPNLILLDILMPVMDGMAMMKKLREDEWGSKVPIIILTNVSANENILKEVIKGEPLYFLIKSDWGLKDVTDTIKKILNQ